MTTSTSRDERATPVRIKCGGEEAKKQGRGRQVVRSASGKPRVHGILLLNSTGDEFDQVPGQYNG